MAKLLTTAPRGTLDVLPQESYKWQALERRIADIADRFGFDEVRTPMFEHTELFARGVGDSTDIVQKEMYTFTDKGDRSITLRPEGTAGVARAVLEHGLLNNPMPLKTYYFYDCFRYEKPQAGRYRQFKQFGIEAYGSMDPACDAEIISLGNEILSELGIEGIELELNSIGCPKCRPAYLEKLVAYFNEHIDSLCPTCKERLGQNPLRVLDCKDESCKKVSAGAPLGIDSLCEECETHFDGVKTRLSAMGIAYRINPMIVRGLDYYTKTVFEFITTKIGAQGTVCGGGRYDGLLETLGGPHTPGIGFGMGLQRLLLLMEAEGKGDEKPVSCELYIANIGTDASVVAQTAVMNARRAGLKAQSDLQGRSLKAQMKFANKIGALYTVVLGDDEVKSGTVQVKEMDTGEQFETTLENLANTIKERL